MKPNDWREFFWYIQSDTQSGLLLWQTKENQKEENREEKGN